MVLKTCKLVIFISDFGEDFLYFSRCEFVSAISKCCSYMVFDGTGIRDVVLTTLHKITIKKEYLKKNTSLSLSLSLSNIYIYIYIYMREREKW